MSYSMSGKDNNWSYGCELEWGDIPRTRKIPEHLGKWDYSEVDILNLKEPYRHIPSDPKGISPPVGGEINTQPSYGIDRQYRILQDLSKLFPERTTATASHTHIHVHIPGLVEDINSLHKLVNYTLQNQEDLIVYGNKYEDRESMNGIKQARSYMKYDGGRRMPDWLAKNLMNTESFSEFIRVYGCGKDGVTRSRPFRYGINLYSLKHIETIEFRMYRGSIDPYKIKECIELSRDFLIEAFSDSPRPFSRVISEKGGYDLPEFKWEAEEFRNLKEKQYDKSRGKKFRRHIKACV